MSLERLMNALPTAYVELNRINILDHLLLDCLKPLKAAYARHRLSALREKSFPYLSLIELIQTMRAQLASQSSPHVTETQTAILVYKKYLAESHPDSDAYKKDPLYPFMCFYFSLYPDDLLASYSIHRADDRLINDITSGELLDFPNIAQRNVNYLFQQSDGIKLQTLPNSARIAPERLKTLASLLSMMNDEQRQFMVEKTFNSFDKNRKELESIFSCLWPIESIGLFKIMPKMAIHQFIDKHLPLLKSDNETERLLAGRIIINLHPLLYIRDRFLLLCKLSTLTGSSVAAPFLDLHSNLAANFARCFNPAPAQPESANQRPSMNVRT